MLPDRRYTRLGNFSHIDIRCGIGWIRRCDGDRRILKIIKRAEEILWFGNCLRKFDEDTTRQCRSWLYMVCKQFPADAVYGTLSSGPGIHLSMTFVGNPALWRSVGCTMRRMTKVLCLQYDWLYPLHFGNTCWHILLGFVWHHFARNMIRKQVTLFHYISFIGF